MRRYVVLCLVVLLAATAGCLSSGPNGGIGSNTVDGESVVTDTVTAIDNITAHRFSLRQTVERRAVENGTNLSLADRRVQRHTGVIDIVDDELRMVVQVNTSERARSQVADVYIEDGVQYTGLRTPNGTRWVTSSNPDGVRRSLSVNNRVSLLGERLSNATSRYIRTETVNGTEARLLEIEPANPDAYVSDIVEPTPDGLRVVNVTATNVSLQLWVSTETDLPVRVHETITARTTNRRSVVGAPETRFRFETEYDAYSYTNDELNISTPEEAKANSDTES